MSSLLRFLGGVGTDTTILGLCTSAFGEAVEAAVEAAAEAAKRACKTAISARSASSQETSEAAFEGVSFVGLAPEEAAALTPEEAAAAGCEVDVPVLVALVESAASEVEAPLEGVVDSTGEAGAAFLARYSFMVKATDFLGGASVEASTNPNELAAVEAATVEAADVEEAV